MLESAFFQDLAILMSFAGAAAMLFSRLQWPKVIGYILAGILMGEHTWGGSFLADPTSTRTIGQLGIVFLMFGMGLSFSPREMKKIRVVAIPAALFDTLVMISLGYLTGIWILGWSAIPSVFLGVAICDSATTLLAKVLDEAGWSKRPFAQYVLGTSVCEDIICVGAIAVATGFATSGSMNARALLGSLGGLGVFFLLVLVFGLIFVPRLLKSVSHRSDDEALVLTMLGCSFFISFFAYKFNFSLALGAFLVGIIGGSSDVRERLERLMSPLKTMFSAVFFASVGLLVDPVSLMNNAPEILLVSAVVIVGKTINIFVVSILTGLDLKTAIQTAFGLAQIGEFAFMVAILYAGLGIDDAQMMFPLAIGASLLTTLLNPLMIRFSDPFANWVEAKVPERVIDALDAYRVWIGRLFVSTESPTRRQMRGFAIRLGVYAALILSVSLVLKMLTQVDFSRFSKFFERHDEIIMFVAANLFTVALLPLVASATLMLSNMTASFLMDGSRLKWRAALGQLIRLAVRLLVGAIFFVEWMMVDLTLAPSRGLTMWILLGLSVIIGIGGWRFFRRAGRQALTRISEALTADERRVGLAKVVAAAIPADALRSLTIKERSPAIGGTVITLNIRAKTGASIVAVRRAGVETRNIGPEWVFQVDDVLVVLGNAEQIAALKNLIEGIGR